MAKNKKASRSRSRSTKKSKSSKKSTPRKRRSKSKSRCTGKYTGTPHDYNCPHATFFPGIDKIQYKGPKSKDPLAYKYYNANEVILGRKIKDWCRFSVVFWHTFRGKGLDPFGGPTMKRPWDDESETLENAYRRVRAAFEFMSKLGIEHYAFHDRDVAPEGKNIKEHNKNFDLVSDLMLKL